MKTQCEIQDYICRMIEEITLGQVAQTDISPDDRLLSDIGLDSLDYATVLLSCEKWMGVKVREAGVDWGQIQSVGDLASFLTRQQDQ